MDELNIARIIGERDGYHMASLTTDALSEFQRRPLNDRNTQELTTQLMQIIQDVISKTLEEYPALFSSKENVEEYHKTASDTQVKALSRAPATSVP